jgi:hypothetical protein
LLLVVGCGGNPTLIPKAKAGPPPSAKDDK